MLLAFLEKMINGYFALVPKSKPQNRDIQQALLIAHRGAHNNARGIFENTHEAFQLARKAGCYGLELDVHVTADNVFVVNHDPTLTRLWGHDVAIASLSFSQLRALVPGVPALAEVIADFGGSMHLFIELKVPLQAEDALVEVLKDLTPCKHYHLLALDSTIFTNMTQFPNQALLLVAGHNNVKQFCSLSISKQYGGVLGSYLLLNDKRIKKLREAGQSFGVGFVDSKYSLYRELKRGIVWIFTNRAVEVNGYLLQLRQRP